MAAPSDEDLGYVTTDDSFSAIFDDAASEWAKRFSEAKHARTGQAVREGQAQVTRGAGDRALADLFDGWGARLRGEKHRDQEPSRLQ